MSEEFEEISVAETEVAPAGAAPAGVEAPVVPEIMPAEVDATKVNLDAGDSVMRQNAQQTFLENSGSERAGGTTALTAAAIAAKEEEKNEKLSAMQEALDNQAKDQDRHREWMERQHEFGGMKISGHDLDKMMNFYANNPQMMDKLKERMTKSGMPKDKVEKGAKEFEEFMALKKKEQEGGKLSDEEQRRLKEIQNSQEFKVAAEQAVRQANEHGMSINATMVKSQAEIISVKTKDDHKEAEIVQTVIKKQAAAQIAQVEAEEDGMIVIAEVAPAERSASAVNEGFVSASARENFPNAPTMQKDFAASSSLTIADVAAKASLKVTTDAPVIMADDQDAAPAALAASSQKMPLAMGARA